MNKQRKVVITTTYNEMGIIIDTKVEEVAQPNLQPTIGPSTNCSEFPNNSDTISRQAAIDEGMSYINGDCFCDKEDFAKYIEFIERLPPIQPEIVRCKDCKNWIPYDWMFSEVWRSKNIEDYPEDEIGCNLCDMAMKADDFCSRAVRREVTK